MDTRPFNRAKLSSMALLGAAALVLVGILSTFYEEQIYRSQKIEEVVAQARILAASVTAAVAFNDETAAQEYVAALDANTSIEMAGVYDQDGIRVASFVRGGVGNLPDTVQPRPAYTANNRVYVAVPIQEGTTVIGTAYLQATMESFLRRLIRYAGIFLLVTMAILVLGILGMAHRALSEANRELESQARELAQSNEKLQTEMIERAKAEEALRQSQKMEAIGQLSGGIAHDFNNLLTIIKGSLQLLQRHLAQGKTDVQRYVDAAIESLNRAATLTQRILAFSRQQPLSPKRVDMSQLIEKMRELTRHSVGDTIHVETSLKSDWEILCDENQMESVILNLLVNARDAMPDGGKIYVATRNTQLKSPVENLAPGDYVEFSVRDTGTGMSEEVRLKAIDPFFTTKPQGRGTGLGLSMAFGYIRQSNGHLSIRSEPGKGTTISILMPRYVAQVHR